MQTDTFERTMIYFGYPEGDKKHVALRLIMVDGLTQAEASRLTDYSPAQLNKVYARVRRDLPRIQALTGVDLCA